MLTNETETHTTQNLTMNTFWLRAFFSLCFTREILGGISLNASGSGFATSLFAGGTFSYQFISSDPVSFWGDSSAVGQCNIMGYWSSDNSNPVGPSASFRAADKAKCGNLAGLTDSDRNRLPLVDYAVSDSPLSADAYKYYPDLQMFPAAAGGVVPIYNIPELNDLYPASPLVLSRTSIALIFTGRIVYWNDSRILADNTGVVKARLSSLSKSINVVVRSESSSVVSIFTLALQSFSTIFSAEVGTSSTPTWCDPKTDEIQRISISSCIAGSSITFGVVDKNKNIRQMSFACDASAATVTTAFLNRN